MIDSKVEQFYDNNIDLCEDLWQEHLFENDWGSGEDRIRITDDMFWEFVENLMDKRNK